MKHSEIFRAFLKDTVNLNETRVSSLESSIDAIKSAIKKSTYEPKSRGWFAHGSWAHKTIIRPVDGAEYDADLLVLVDPIEGWSAAKYVNSLFKALEPNSTYSDKLSRSSHCITISYARDKRIDVAPCLLDRSFNGSLEVCNRNTDEFEYTEPEKYTDWLIDCNNLSGQNSFRKVTRLLKYLRDIKGTFTCPSVLLTTIIGNQITKTDQNSDAFADVPSALKTIVGRIDAFLQANVSRPYVQNPFLSEEDFATLWTDSQYQNFRDVMSRYREWIDDAFMEVNKNESISKWRRVFGEDFAGDVVLKEAATLQTTASSHWRSLKDTADTAFADLVDAIKRIGQRAIPSGFDIQPHMKSPTWKFVRSDFPPIRIVADLFDSRSGTKLAEVQDFRPLPRDKWLQFRVINANNGFAFSQDAYEVRWRVTNTDKAALEAGCLRGDFYSSHTGNTRWETLSYRGVHIVEAFVVRKRDKSLLKKSEPFLVLIE